MRVIAILLRLLILNLQCQNCGPVWGHSRTALRRGRQDDDDYLYYAPGLGEVWIQEDEDGINGYELSAFTSGDEDGDGVKNDEDQCLEAPTGAEVDAIGCATSQPDNDGDGFTGNQEDCNDNDATTYPGANEICGDGIDQDCDGEDKQCIVFDIKANGSDGPIIKSTDNLSIEIQLTPGGYAGDNADWWLVAATPFGFFHYQPSNGLWESGLTYSHQGPLFSLEEFEVLNISGLPTGSYTIYCGVDMNMNGSLDIDKAHYDFVTVNVKSD